MGEREQTFVYNTKRALAYFFTDSIVTAHDAMGGRGLGSMGRGGDVGSSHGNEEARGGRGVSGRARGWVEGREQARARRRSGRGAVGQDNSLGRTLDSHQHVPRRQVWQAPRDQTPLLVQHRHTDVSSTGPCPIHE
jgi:hypothetical protein